MYRIGIILLGMTTLVSSGILMDRNRVGLNIMQGMGLNNNQGLGLDQLEVLSRDELLRQKFILDLLLQVNLPLQNQELLQLQHRDITTENMYIQPLDEDMIFVLDLIRKNQMLGKNTICSINNDLHLRQMVGLYRLLVNARDFHALQHIAVYCRMNINTELFVNSLILALGERLDTKMLIIPALHEILPQLYHDRDLIEQVRHVGEQNLLSNNGLSSSSVRPNIIDVINMGRQNRLMNSRLLEGGPMMNILNKSYIWMPWRQLHQQLALRKTMGGRTLLQDEQNLDKLVITQPIVQNKPLGLLTEDIGLKSYLNMLIDEIIVKHRGLGITQLDERQILGGGIHNIDTTRDQDLLGLRRDNLVNTDRLLLVGRRLRNKLDNMDSGVGVGMDKDNLVRGNILGRQQGIDRDVIVGLGRGLVDDMDRMNTRQVIDRDMIGQRGVGLGRGLVDDIDRMNTRQVIDRDMIGQRGVGLGRGLVDIDRDMIGQRGVGGDRDILGQNVLGINDRDILGQRGIGLGRQLKDDNINIERNLDRDLIGQRTNILGRRLIDDTDRLNLKQGLRVGDDNVSVKNNDRLLFVGRRHKNDDLNIEQRLVSDNDDLIRQQDRNILGNGMQNRNILGNGMQDRNILGSGMQDRNILGNRIQDQNVLNNQRDKSVSLNSDRLLLVGRRRKNLSGIEITNDMQNSRLNEDDDMISGGRRVSKDEQRDNKRGKDERRKLQLNDDDDDLLYLNRRQNPYVNDNQDRLLNDNIRLDRLGINDNRGINLDDNRQGGVGINRGLNRGMNSLDNTDNIDRGLYYRNKYGQGRQGMMNRDDVMGRSSNIGLMRNEGDILQKQGLYHELPTTTIDDERLLHINRRRLNDVVEGRRVGTVEEGDRMYVDRDDDTIRRGNLLNRNMEEGDRKYVDRDGDTIRRGINRNMEEGDRKYVDRDGDTIRRGNFQNRNMEEGDRKYVDRDDDRIRGINQQNDIRRDQLNNRRYRRSLDNINLINDRSLNGRLLLHNLQQLAARINIEQISLQLSEKLDHLGLQGINRNLINDISNVNQLNDHHNILMLEKIHDICQRLDLILQKLISRITSLTYEEQLNEIGLLLGEQIIDLGLIDMLNLDQRQKGQLSNILEQPLNQLLLCRIMNIVDSHIKNLLQDRDLLLKGVTINDMNVDKLQTFLEYSEVDLSNLLTTSQIQTDGKNMKLLVGRVPRLNHKSFHIKLDISSDRQQRVVIRTLLGPKLDALGNILDLNEQRQNFVLLDINSIDLKQGRNLIKLNSNDITWTTRDTTPYSEIYERVMRSLKGDSVLTKNLLIGQNNLFPHRLLLPRGLVKGLPMQLLTVITPIDQDLNIMDRQLIGLDSLLLDRLPLNYPLDINIQNINELLAIPNLLLKDVKIYHDDKLKMPLLM